MIGKFVEGFWWDSGYSVRRSKEGFFAEECFDATGEQFNSLLRNGPAQPSALGNLGELPREVHGAHKDGCAGNRFLDLPSGIQAVHSRHQEVKDNQVRMDLIGTPSTGSNLTSIVSEWAGLSGIADGSGTATGTVSPIRTGAVTTGNANALLIAVGGDTGSATPGSWTAFNPTYTAQLPQAKIEAAYQIVSATGSYSHTLSDNGSTGWDAVITAIQGSGIALIQQAAAGLTGYPGYLYVVFNQEPRPGDVLVVTNVSSNNQVNVSGGGVASWNYVWSQAHENTVIVYGTVGSNPDNRVRMDLIGTPSGTGDLTSIVSEWAGLSGTVDSSGTATGTASPIQTGTLTTVNATDLLIAVGGDTGSMTPGWWTAFTPPTQQPHAKIQAAYQIVSATGSYSNTWSDIGSTGWDAVIAAFK